MPPLQKLTNVFISRTFKQQFSALAHKFYRNNFYFRRDLIIVNCQLLIVNYLILRRLPALPR